MMTFHASSPCRVRRETRTCKHPGCGGRFEGSPTSLYCPQHRTRKSRAERYVPKEAPKPEDCNLVIEMCEDRPRLKTMQCSLPHCHRRYAFAVYPDHNIYPMYCEFHRTEHQRRHFLRMVAAGKTPACAESIKPENWSDYESQFEEYALKQPALAPFQTRHRRHSPRGAKYPNS